MRDEDEKVDIMHNMHRCRDVEARCARQGPRARTRGRLAPPAAPHALSSIAAAALYTSLRTSRFVMVGASSSWRSAVSRLEVGRSA